MRYSSIAQYREHMQETHGIAPLGITAYIDKQAMIIGKSNNRFRCPKCALTFTEMAELRDHYGPNHDPTGNFRILSVEERVIAALQNGPVDRDTLVVITNLARTTVYDALRHLERKNVVISGPVYYFTGRELDPETKRGRGRPRVLFTLVDFGKLMAPEGKALQIQILSFLQTKGLSLDIICRHFGKPASVILPHLNFMVHSGDLSTRDKSGSNRAHHLVYYVKHSQYFYGSAGTEGDD
jgi:hypothetical protein